eukprot:CAMPEP_0203787686 /NCGR_PEP_ID=MMETSP0100_2-20121128/2389_1 /ASSEMBLY_ACC=CAM_ASM_000210 /TAXON_ID=96639 /ORGANISM=" , Strain NY0313808BC1" /LENGTH=191 /DNA_ID=CAMNT_0050690265 /DNA_START=71 /DNA_END=643 /DNA_ORIENTATION=-
MKNIFYLLAHVCLSLGTAKEGRALRPIETAPRFLDDAACSPFNKDGVHILFKFHNDNPWAKCITFSLKTNNVVVKTTISQTVSKSFWRMFDSNTWQCFTTYTDIDDIDFDVSDCSCGQDNCNEEANKELVASINPNQYAWVDYNDSYYYVSAFMPVCRPSCNKCVNPEGSIVSPTKVKTSIAEGDYCGNCI